VQPRERLGQLPGRHGQLDRVVIDRLAPAKILQQPQVLGELTAHRPRLGELTALDAQPDIADPSEVRDNQLVDGVALCAGNRHGHALLQSVTATKEQP
jgi:hypothetical protein